MPLYCLRESDRQALDRPYSDQPGQSTWTRRREQTVNYDERLIGPEPPDDFQAQSAELLDALFKRRFDRREQLRTARRSVEAATFEVMRGHAGDDPRLSAAVKKARELSTAHAKQHPRAPRRAKRPARQHMGSISVTFVPPFWQWNWTATTGSATASANANGNAGTLSFDAWTGNDGKTASAAAALGYYFQPIADNGLMDVSANPGYSYDWQTWTVFDSAHAGDFIGLYVGEYTLQGEFIEAVVDQQISMSDYESSGQPLFARTPVDSDHLYEIWVWAGGDAEADGWSAFWGSAALSNGSVTVPSISVYAY
jgi:hypothetical protein